MNNQKRDTAAAIMSFFFPGVGQIIQGRMFTGICCFMMTIAGYMFFVLPGIILHLMAIHDAANFHINEENKKMAKANKIPGLVNTL